MLENATRSDVTVAPFGSWRSPIDSDLIATDTISWSMFLLMAKTSIGSRTDPKKVDGLYW